MTKYEWESELKKNIHRLPDEEIRRVLEYYDELFADKIEQGGRETEIVAQFGNPVDVADKILSEYDGELREENAGAPPPDMRGESKTPPPDTRGRDAHVDEPLRQSAPVLDSAAQNNTQPAHDTAQQTGSAPKKKGTFHGERLAIVIIALVLTGGAVFDVLAAFIITTAALSIAGWAMLGGGAIGTAVSVVTMFTSFGAGLAQVGACVAVAGLGILFAILFSKAATGLVRLTVLLVKAIVGWVYTREETQHA